jgi:1-acyl-sn-glycerol-3-phosphate acyltransferase
MMPRREPEEVRGINRLLWWINRFYCTFLHRVESKSPDTLPKQGSALLICNHTCCIDHLLLQSATRRVLGFIIAQEYFDFWLFRPFCRLTGCIPVRRDGKDLAATRAALRAIKEGRVVVIFPEGHIVPTSGRELGEGKPGAAFLALNAKAPVVPAYLCGTPPTNEVIPSLFTPSRVQVWFGPVVDLDDLLNDPRPDREKLAAATDRLMASIRALRDRAMGEPRDQPEIEREATAFVSGRATDGERAANSPGPVSSQHQAVGGA